MCSKQGMHISPTYLKVRNLNVEYMVILLISYSVKQVPYHTRYYTNDILVFIWSKSISTPHTEGFSTASLAIRQHCCVVPCNEFNIRKLKLRESRCNFLLQGEKTPLWKTRYFKKTLNTYFF